MSFDLGLLSKYKVEMMGLSIILIVLGHATASGVVFPFHLEKLIIASMGTICFFLLSGMGMYYSLSKFNSLSTKELLHWYKRRYARLLVPYLILTVPVYAVTVIHDGGSFIDYILMVTTISFWYPPHEGMWFIAMIVPLYLLAPVAFLAVRKLKSQWMVAVFYIAVITAMILFGRYSSLNDGYFYRAIFFFIGMWITPSIREGKRVNWGFIVFVSLLLYVVTCFVPIFNNFPRYLFLFPPFIFIACAGYGWLSRYSKNIISKTSAFMGRISLEMYLTHVYFAGLLLQFHVVLFPEAPLLTAYIQYTAVVVFSIICSIYVNKLSKWIMKQMNV